VKDSDQLPNQFLARFPMGPWTLVVHLLPFDMTLPFCPTFVEVLGMIEFPPASFMSSVEVECDKYGLEVESSSFLLNGVPWGG